jgi:LuxR family maltose regulon positive regulatory protein
MPAMPLPAKLAAPRQRGVVARDRLFAALDALADTACVVLGAAPGAGKTTLLASYAKARDLPTLWYQADAGDRDLAAFFADMGLAVQHAAPRRKKPLPVYGPEHGVRPGLFARRYFREAFARLQAPCCVVWDNVQEAGTPAFMEALRAAVEECPPDIRLFILTRGELPPNFAALEATRRLARLDGAALRFTAEETAAMLPGLDRDCSADVHRRTDGWAAGIVLAASQPGSTPQAVSADSGESVFRYFSTEILQSMSRETQRILHLTALLPQISAEHAVALTGDPGAPKVLEMLYRRQLFTSLLQGSTPVYQYHGLFRAFLLANAEHAVPAAELDAAREQAARLLVAAGDVATALDMLAATGRWDCARAVLKQSAPALLKDGRHDTLYRAMEALAAAEAAGHASAHGLDKAWLHYYMGLARMREDESTAGHWFEQAYHAFAAAGDAEGELRCAAAAIRSLHGAWSTYVGLAEWDRRLRAALPRAPAVLDPALELDVCSAIISSPPLSATSVAAPEDIAARAERVLALITGAGRTLDANSVLTAARALVKHSEMVFDPALFDRACALAELWLRDPHLSPLVLGRWLVAVGRCHFFFQAGRSPGGKRDRAAAAWNEARSLAQREERPHLLFDIIYAEVLVPMLGADHGRFIELVDALETVVDFGRVIHAASYYYLRCRACLLQGDVDGALQAGEQMQAAAAAGEMPAVQLAWLTIYHAYAMAAAQREDEAIACLQTLRGRLPPALGRQAMILDSVTALTTAVQQRRRGQEHLPSLALGLGMAAQASWPGFYNAAPGLAAALCADALDAQLETAFVRRCIAQQRLQPPPGASDAWPWPVAIRLLGAFELKVDGQVVEFGAKVPKKPLELLQLMAAQGPDGIDAGQAVDALWPDTDRAAARASFNVAVHRLRKLLQHEDAIVLHDGRLRLDGARAWCDLAAFEHTALDVAERDLARIGEPLLHRRADQVLALYRGPLLANQSANAWISLARNKTQNRFVQCVTALGVQLEHRALWQAALALYERGLEQDPLAEALYRGQIRCYLSMQQPASALGAFRRCKELLSIVLGVAPAQDTQELVRQAYG